MACKLECDVRQQDGSLVPFEHTRISKTLTKAYIATGQHVNDESRATVEMLSAQIVDVLAKDLSDSKVVDSCDIQVQIGITLMLNQYRDLANAYNAISPPL